MVSLLLPLFLIADWNDTPLGLDVTKLRQFPLERVPRSERDGSVDGIQVKAHKDSAWGEVLLQKSTPKASWSLDLFGLREVWKADLDGNGTKDYVFSGPGPFWNGRATALYSLVILLMEPDGMPVPYFTTMYNRPDSPALRHLVDLDQDGRAELIVSHHDDYGSDPNVGPFCSGHWVHQLYRFRNFAAEEYRGPAAGLRFPIAHPWTYGPKVCGSSSGMPVHPAPMDDWGTVPFGRSRVAAVAKSEVGMQIDPPVKGCQFVTPMVAVYDGPGRREIAYTSQSDVRLTALVERIRESGAQVELRGIRRWDPNSKDCTVNLLWATRR